jgi:quercetin dioxygenase-like cupin family protein
MFATSAPRILKAVLFAASGFVQPFSYPTKKPARVTAAIVTMPPGGTTGWHEHPVPLFGYMLEGEITVDYGPHGKRVYRKGDALMEAIDAAHDGHNTGQGVARILAVFMGAEGVSNTMKVAAPK